MTVKAALIGGPRSGHMVDLTDVADEIQVASIDHDTDIQVTHTYLRGLLISGAMGQVEFYVYFLKEQQ